MDAWMLFDFSTATLSGIIMYAQPGSVLLIIRESYLRLITYACLRSLECGEELDRSKP